MDFRTIVTYFKFSREQRNGILLLFGIIIVLQLIYFFVDFSVVAKNYPEKQKWLSLQSQIDSMKTENQAELPKIYLFNPNFITDYKGYKLGMSVEEIDRLLSFRKENKYVNSPKEFQNVTKISDSLLNAIAPYFKFPEWVNNKKEFKAYKNYSNQAFAKKEKIVLIDINQATQEDLIKIYGIGEAISLRILKQKESLGGFVSMEQMKDVWGLSPEVIENLNAHFKVSVLPNFKKIDINNASLKELSQFSYFRYALAKEIVTYRSMKGDIKDIEDLIKIKGFPVDKAKIIDLYLDF
ncbi:ComEA family DNA-binding protein [Flavobacterium gawalongense]|uniref:Helix-hairpin-helix domain-containing protein n=1 Tax=Flavobacterium gawalongense TaxID=2594432 RepID=A0A553BKE1_9FLAO|nr:helix-hairpin-helix domain-containing protein [Flavobacterium gawalongense]TRX04001.1 helix-hairpin-helix domain-containing protein [Flavobacterium gawalongense]TRX07179.1 helix-hairpin-helix domain-containing protein [Flavobacterium gawalongense]TRX08710.1 helix-hairpin-helix domain-containing protein [Flavobacterium gawalongense]TRX09453.1 helix-hairpin-helix domain-containing protein [Flavobacterium gawalongense]TRX25424.1 helix-hairpin-helix domain-containing protein [Flavobacterium gaw